MKNYCPTCDAEYQKNISLCPTCGLKLLKSSPGSPPRVVGHEIYGAADQLEEERIIADLKGLGLRVVEEELHISQLPTIGDRRYVIIVHPADQGEVLKRIKQLRHDAIISDQGSFI